MNCFQRRWNALKIANNVPETDPTLYNLQTVIGMDNIPNGEYSIDLTSYDTYCILHVHYTNTRNTFDLLRNNILELPPEINSMISAYLPSYLILNIRIDFPPNYPFDSPIWSLIDCADHLVSSLQHAEEYYKYIINTHNTSNILNWSPAVKIDNDILVFMVRCNHFDSLFIS